MSHYKTKKQIAGYLRDFQAGRDNFGALLMRLIQKADKENGARLFEGFPEAVAFYGLWEASPDPETFMKEALE